MDESNEDILKKIISVSKNIRSKYRNLKRGQADTEYELSKTFKPITRPLEELVVKTEQAKHTNTTLKNPDEEIEDTFYSQFTPEKSAKKRKIFQTPFQTPRTARFLESEIIATADEDSPSPTKIVRESLEKSIASRDELSDLLGDVAAEYFKFYLTADDKDKDLVYGIRRTSDGEWMIGNSKVVIDKNDLIIKDKWYEGTPGLYELLFKKNYKNYTEEDENNYTDIVMRTNAHRLGYSDFNKLNNNRSKKYREIIKPVIQAGGEKQRSYSLTDSVTGYGILPKYMSVTPNHREYTYWDNPNELVERLQLLISSRKAGHTGHNNEILSIIEELREANIIE